MKNQTSDLQIPRSDALPLSHSDSTMSKVYREVHLTCVLHTARISNVDGVVFVMLMTRRKTSFSISLPSSKLTISFISTNNCLCLLYDCDLAKNHLISFMNLTFRNHHYVIHEEFPITLLVKLGFFFINV